VVLYLWFGAFLLHNLSRVLPPYPALVAAAAVGALLFASRAGHARDVTLVLLASWAVTAYIVVIDVSREGGWPSAGNLVRLLTPVVALSILLLADVTEEALRKLSLVYVAIVALAALSMFWQVVNGPIEWFAEASERAGVARYASLLGSLTVFGTAAPIALLAAAMYVRRPMAFVGVATLIFAGGVMSLQKSAIAGFVVMTPFVLLLLERGTRIKLGFALGALVLLVLALVPTELLDYAVVGWQYFASAGTGGGTDVGLGQSMVERLTELPREVIEYHGAGKMLLGVGLQGGGGVFGFPELPMPHNGIVDYLAIGGLPYLAYGLLLLGMTFVSAARIVRWRAHVEEGWRVAVFVTGIVALYVANLPFASGLGFHPAFCWIPPLLISFAYSVRARTFDTRARTAPGPARA
jgi:hypothetical protein